MLQQHLVPSSAGDTRGAGHRAAWCNTALQVQAPSHQRHGVLPCACSHRSRASWEQVQRQGRRLRGGPPRTSAVSFWLLTTAMPALPSAHQEAGGGGARLAAPYQASYELDCRSTFSGTLSSPRNSSPNFKLLAFQRSTLKNSQQCADRHQGRPRGGGPATVGLIFPSGVWASQAFLFLL